MPSKSNKSSIRSSNKSHAFACRICKWRHPLRTCRKFLAMNVTDRIRAVKSKKYCQNCLAHDHSQGTCFSKHGCKRCKKMHHTLLHINQRLLKKSFPSSSRKNSRSPSPKTTSPSSNRKLESNEKESPRPSTSKSSLSSMLRQNSVVLLPTVSVKIATTTSNARCLLDSGSAFSRVSKKLVDKLDLTAFTLREETICPITLKSRSDSSVAIEGTFRVDNRIAIHTPSQSLSSSYKNNFRNLVLADTEFYKRDPIDIVIGADLYSRIISDGVISKTGLPTAQSTLFGWTIYGPCTL